MKGSSEYEGLSEGGWEWGRVDGIGCLVSNTADDELPQCASSALPEIEDAVLNRVAPGSGDVADHNDLLHRHPGLLGLWNAYFHIGREGHVARIAQFLRSLDGPVLATGILA